MASPEPPQRTVTRVLAVAGVALLAAWAVWWAVALSRGSLPLADRLWFKAPAFGADFWSQSDYAARLWRAGLDPYENERHLFHYPPIVIRMFLWTPLFGHETALRIWISVLAVLLVLGAALSWRTRRLVGVEPLPLVFVLGVLLTSLPLVFTLERANFDLITLAAILCAVPLLERRDPRAELLAGALLAFGPWVKIYPGLIGIALVAMRRWRALVGFVVCGVTIFAVMPQETIRSFEVLALAIARTKASAVGVGFPPWSHSLSIGWRVLVGALGGGPLAKVLAAVPGSLVAVLVLAGPLVWVSRAVYRVRDATVLAYPVLTWVVAAASFVPEIANDYSLAFLPLSTAAVASLGDPRPVLAGLALSLVAWQPFALPLSGAALMALKLVWLLSTAGSIVARARELAPGDVAPPAPDADPAG